MRVSNAKSTADLIQRPDSPWLLRTFNKAVTPILTHLENTKASIKNSVTFALHVKLR